MTERLRSASTTTDHQSDNVKMESDLSPRKTLVVLVIVVGCFAVLWPKVFYPMLVGSAKEHSKPSPIDKTTGCCDVISEIDVNTIKIMSELCGTIIKSPDEEKPLTGKEIVQRCRQEVLETCGIDISAVLQEQVRLGQNVKHILDEIRSLNGSLCLKYNFGVAPWRLGVPHRITVKVSNVRQERPLHLRTELIHPAFRERGRAIPQPQAAPPTRPPPRVVEGRPGPVPGMRPTIGGAGHVVPPSKQGTSSMSVIMPIYTIGIVIFFTYTLMKVLFKKQPEGVGGSLYPPIEPDPHFRKEVFESEKSRLGPRLTRESISTKLVVNAMSALLDEVDQEIEARRKTNEVAPQDLANGTLSNGDALKPQDTEEQSTVKVMGMETTASCEGGQKWSRSESPVLPTSHPAPEPIPPPQEIYLEGALPPQSHLLVANSATESQQSSEEDPAVVLAGKVTLSVISLDPSENGAEEKVEVASAEERIPLPEEPVESVEPNQDYSVQDPFRDFEEAIRQEFAEKPMTLFENIIDKISRSSSKEDKLEAHDLIESTPLEKDIGDIQIGDSEVPVGQDVVDKIADVKEITIQSLSELTAPLVQSTQEDIEDANQKTDGNLEESIGNDFTRKIGGIKDDTVEATRKLIEQLKSDPIQEIRENLKTPSAEEIADRIEAIRDNGVQATSELIERLKSDTLREIQGDLEKPSTQEAVDKIEAIKDNVIQAVSELIEPLKTEAIVQEIGVNLEKPGQVANKIEEIKDSSVPGLVSLAEPVEQPLKVEAAVDGNIAGQEFVCKIEDNRNNTTEGVDDLIEPFKKDIEGGIIQSEENLAQEFTDKIDNTIGTPEARESIADQPGTQSSSKAATVKPEVKFVDVQSEEKELVEELPVEDLEREVDDLIREAVVSVKQIQAAGLESNDVEEGNIEASEDQAAEEQGNTSSISELGRDLANEIQKLIGEESKVDRGSNVDEKEDDGRSSEILSDEVEVGSDEELVEIEEIIYGSSEEEEEEESEEEEDEEDLDVNRISESQVNGDDLLEESKYTTLSASATAAENDISEEEDTDEEVEDDEEVIEVDEEGEDGDGEAEEDDEVDGGNNHNHLSDESDREL